MFKFFLLFITFFLSSCNNSPLDEVSYSEDVLETEIIQYSEEVSVNFYKEMNTKFTVSTSVQNNFVTEITKIVEQAKNKWNFSSKKLDIYVVGANRQSVIDLCDVYRNCNSELEPFIFAMKGSDAFYSQKENTYGEEGIIVFFDTVFEDISFKRLAFHELFHAYQFHYADASSIGALQVDGPWLIEGGAELFSEIILYQLGYQTEEKFNSQMEVKLFSKEEYLSGTIPLNEIQYGSQLRPYYLGAWFTVYLISEVGYEVYLVDFYEDLHTVGVEETVKKYFSTDIPGVIKNFNNFLAQENDILLMRLNEVLDD